jgi:predicted nucleotidyltransferase component of viral defense system
MLTTGIAPDTLDCLKLLSSQTFVDQYYLAGGTAVALHYGHRRSYDLDFFSVNPIEPQPLLNHLTSLGKLEVKQNDAGTFNGQLNQTKLSFFAYLHPLLEPVLDFEGIRIASIPDLAAMKLEAISSRGTKRDFIDAYFIAQDKTLFSMFDWFNRRYQDQNVSQTHVLKSLTYFIDAESDPMPDMVKTLDWSSVKSFFQTEVKRLAHDWGIV